MNKFPGFILNIGTYSLGVTLISLMIGFLTKEDSAAQAISYGIAFYGTIITIFPLLFQLFITVISFIISPLNDTDHS